MPDVRMPDGVVVRFPDEMPADQIKGIIAQKFPDTAKPAAPAEMPAPALSERASLPGTERMDPFGVGVSQGMTFGFGDEILSGLMTPIEMGVRAYRGEDAGKGLMERASGAYDKLLNWNRGIVDRAEAEAPVATTMGNIAGGLTGGGALQKAGVTLLNASKPTLGSMVGRGAAEGAAYGAATGFGEGEGLDDRLGGAATGAATGAAFGAAAGAMGARSASKAAKESIPTAEGLKKAASEAYKAADDAGVVLAPEGLQRLKTGLQDDLAQFGYHPDIQPGIRTVLNEIDRISEQPTTLKGLELLRRITNNVRDTTNPSEAELGRRVVGRIDEFLSTISNGDVIMGDATTGVRALQEARRNWSQARKADMIDTAMEKAGNRAPTSGTGANIENTIRQNIRQILEKHGKTFTPDERLALQKIVRGTPTQNIARLFGKLAPTGVVSAALSSGMGAALGGTPGAIAAGAIGFGAKKAAETMAARNVGQLQELVRSGGNLPAVQQITPRLQAILHALLQQGATQVPAMAGNNSR